MDNFTITSSQTKRCLKKQNASTRGKRKRMGNDLDREPVISTCGKRKRLGNDLDREPVSEERQKRENSEPEKIIVHEDDKASVGKISRLRSTKTQTVNADGGKQTQESRSLHSKQDELSNIGGYKAEIVGKYDLREKSDKIESDIFDICQLQDGGFLVTDRCNKKVKRLSHTYDVIDSCKFKTATHSVCIIGAEEGAVSLLNKKVAIISLGKKLKQKRSFSTRDYCRGMVYANGMLYVCCGDVTNTCTGSIEVFTESGQLVRHLTNFQSYSSLVPVNITISDVSNSLFFTSCNSNEVIKMDLNGNFVKAFCVQNFQVPSRLCTNSQGQVFLCGTNNHAVAVFSAKNEDDQATLDRTDGIKTPTAVCYDVVQSRLVVYCDNSHLLFVIQLNHPDV